MKTIKTTTIAIAFLIFFSANTFASPFEDGMSAYNKGDYSTAYNMLKPIAEQGDASAQFNLGLLYLDGKGLPQDYTEAAGWFRRAAEQGDAGAQNNLGTFYSQGLGVVQDYAEAARWYRKAAEQGYAAAQNSLGNMYIDGKGVYSNWQEAIKLYRASAKQGNSTAQYNLGIHLLDSAFGINEPEARQWLKIAAQGSDPKIASLAQKELNRLVSHEAAVEQSLEEQAESDREWARQQQEMIEFNQQMMDIMDSK
jgi:uncharacterized protein